MTAAYYVTILGLVGLTLVVVLDLRRWARRARKGSDK
jgi:hypothetical protein